MQSCILRMVLSKLLFSSLFMPQMCMRGFVTAAIIRLKLLLQSKHFLGATLAVVYLICLVNFDILGNYLHENSWQNA